MTFVTKDVTLYQLTCDYKYDIYNKIYEYIVTKSMTCMTRHDLCDTYDKIYN